MPFSNYYIRSACYTVGDALLLKGDVDDPMTEIIVNKIVDLVMAGASNDADRLAELVLSDLADATSAEASDKPQPTSPAGVFLFSTLCAAIVSQSLSNFRSTVGREKNWTRGLGNAFRVSQR
jgi:hypothetical protein